MACGEALGLLAVRCDKLPVEGDRGEGLLSTYMDVFSRSEDVPSAALSSQQREVLPERTRIQ